MKRKIAAMMAALTVALCFAMSAEAYVYKPDGSNKYTAKYDTSVQDFVITPENKHGVTVEGADSNIVTEGTFAGKSAFKVTLPDSADDSAYFGWVNLKNLNLPINDYNYVKYEYYVEELDGADTDTNFSNKKPYAQLVTVSGSNVWKDCAPQGEYSVAVGQMAVRHWSSMVIPIVDDGKLDGKSIQSVCLCLLGVMAWHKNAEVYVTNITFSSHSSGDFIANVGVQQKIGSDSTNQSLRFVSAVSDIDFEDYKCYGLKLVTEVGGSKSESDVKRYTLYTSVLADGKTVTPDEYDGKYFGVYTLSDAAAGERVKYSVTFYLEKKDGTLIYSDSFIFVTEADGSISTKVVEHVNDVKASNKYITGTTDKASVSYKTGEEIVFSLSLQADGQTVACDKFVWTLTGDDGSKQTGTEKGNTGTITVKTTLNKAGFVYLQVSACDSAGKALNGVRSYNGGAGVDIENVKKTTSEPSDFDEFWEQRLAALDSVEPELISCVEVNTTATDFYTYAVKVKFYEGTHGNYVSGYLTVPKNASAGSLSIKMWYNGYGVEDPTTYWNKNTALFNVCAHSIEIGRESSYYSSLKSGKLNGYGFDKTQNSDPETVYFKEMLLRDVQALRFMRKYFGENGTDTRFAGLWDGSTVSLIGGSQGGFQAIAVAALDGNVSSVSAYCPWLCDIGGQGMNGKQKSNFMPEYTSALEYYDTINFAKRLNCEILLGTVGLGDYTTPPAGITALYNSLPETITKKIVYVQNRTHSTVPLESFEYTVRG